MVNVLKIITCCPDPAELDASYEFGKTSRTPTLDHHGSKLAIVPFFIAHYGIFCLVHGVFVFGIFGHDVIAFGLFGELRNFVRILTERQLWWCIVPLAGSHLYSFFRNYLGRGEYRRTIAMMLMIQPYGRVVLLHVAILFGGFVALALGSNVGVLAILIAGKTAVDLYFHLRERRRNAGDRATTRPDVVLDESPR
jgi:hypothetical protein